jgi:4-aminobutyrate aminotransferase/(S)-3-amino-2-methylpropionate transaminase
LACAAALAVLDVFEEENLVARSVTMGAMIRDRLLTMQRRNDLLPIAEVRGPGAMIAFDVVKERGSHEPDAEATRRVVARACDRGLVLLSCGVYANTIRILVPLTASDAIVREGLDLLEDSLIDER